MQLSMPASKMFEALTSVCTIAQGRCPCRNCSAEFTWIASVSSVVQESGTLSQLRRSARFPPGTSLLDLELELVLVSARFLPGTSLLEEVLGKRRV